MYPLPTKAGLAASLRKLVAHPTVEQHAQRVKPSGWSSMTWCLASGTSTTGARGPIKDDI